MDETTLYLPENLRSAIKRDTRPAPQGALFTGERPTARFVDELLDGFGKR